MSANNNDACNEQPYDVSKVNGPGEPQSATFELSEGGQPNRIAEAAAGAASALAAPANSYVTEVRAVDFTDSTPLQCRPVEWSHEVARFEHRNLDNNTFTKCGAASGNSHEFLSMPNPTEEDLKDPLFDAIYNVIKNWDVNAPAYYGGYCGANGSHAKLIMDAVRKTKVFGMADLDKGAVTPTSVVDSQSYLERFQANSARLTTVFAPISSDVIGRLSTVVDASFPIQLALANETPYLISNPTAPGVTYHATPESMMVHMLTLLEIRAFPSYDTAPEDVHKQWQQDAKALSEYIFTGEFSPPADSVDQVVFHEVAAALDMYTFVDGGAVHASPEAEQYVREGARVLGEQWLRFTADLKKIMS